MVGVQDEEHVERALEDRIRPVLLHADPEQHVQEVGRVGEFVLRIHVRQPAMVPERERGQRGDLRDRAHDLDPARLRVVDFFGIRIERGERRGRAGQDAHRVGVVAEPVQHLEDVLMNVGVERHLLHEVVQLGLGGQLPLQEQIGDLEVRGPLRQLLDRVAAIAQDPLIAVDEGDGATGRDGIRVGRIVGHHPEVALVDLDLAQVHRADHVALEDVDLVVLAGPVVPDAEGVLPALSFIRHCSSVESIEGVPSRGALAPRTMKRPIVYRPARGLPSRALSGPRTRP